MSIVQARAVRVPRKGRQLWDSFFHFVSSFHSASDFRSVLNDSEQCVYSLSNFTGSHRIHSASRNVLNESKTRPSPHTSNAVVLPRCVFDCSPSTLPLPLFQTCTHDLDTLGAYSRLCCISVSFDFPPLDRLPARQREGLLAAQGRVGADFLFNSWALVRPRPRLHCANLP